MYWNSKIIVLLAIAILHVIAQENEEFETTTLKALNEETSPISADTDKTLDSKLRSALLKALTDLENEGAVTTKQKDSNEDDEGDVRRAQASAITIFANENNDSDESKSSSEEQSEEKDSKSKADESRSSESEEDPSKQKAELVIFQKSDALESRTVTSLEKNPLDPLKEAEQFITSASNSFVSKEATDESSKNKITNYSNLNTISNSESTKPSKTTITDKFSTGKAIDEPIFIKTFVRPLGPHEDFDVSSTTENSVVNEFETEKSNENINDVEAATQRAAEVSTEESEAKVEQVQFFSAPLVAAFTVHQDEKGQPKKVEPIYKNGLDSKKQELIPTQKPNIPQVSQPSESILQSSLFNSLGIQQKQKILEQELEKLRKQQNSNLLTQKFNNLDSNSQRFTQTGFNQAVNQNFNQFDPVFTEPDRSIVTKLATIDPSNLLEQPILNRFMPSDAIVSRLNNNVQPNNPNQIVPESKPSFQSGTVSLIPSISFDPLIEAGKLPKNAQILPIKGPRGFHSFVKLPTLNNNGPNFITPTPAFIEARQPQNPNIPSGLNIIRPALNSLENQPNNGFLKQDPEPPAFSGFPIQSNQNRFLRQEQGTNSLGFNQNTFSIVPAHQPFAPKHELGYFPDNNRFLRQNEASLAQPQDTRLFRNNQLQNNGFNSNTQNQKGFLSPQKIQIQQSVQPFETPNRFFRSNVVNLVDPQKFSQNNRFLRSNQEGTGFLQSYRYSNSFGFPSIPLH